MSECEKEPSTPADLQQESDELRWRVDLLAEEKRPHLYRSASPAEQQHRGSPDDPMQPG